MNTALGLTKHILAMRFPWNLWVGLLGLVNIGGGLFFIQRLEGLLTLAAMAGAFVVMLLIYRKCGFVRLLGLGHILFWIPLVVRFAWVLAAENSSGAFQIWALSLLTVNGASLIIDLVDVWRYFRGERSPLS